MRCNETKIIYVNSNCLWHMVTKFNLKGPTHLNKAAAFSCHVHFYRNSNIIKKLLIIYHQCLWLCFIGYKCHITTFRSSRPEVFCKKDVLGNFAKFTGKATLLKKRLWHRCFPLNFMKFLRTPFLTEHLRWLLLHIQIAALEIFMYWWPF